MREARKMREMRRMRETQVCCLLEMRINDFLFLGFSKG